MGVLNAPRIASRSDSHPQPDDLAAIELDGVSIWYFGLRHNHGLGRMQRGRSVHGKVSGRPILKGSRVTADFVLENYDEGYAPVEVEWMFRLCVGRVQAVIDYAEQSGAVAADRALKALARSEVIDWSGCREVESVPGKVDGMPLIKGTSVPAVAIFDDAGYSSVEELAHEYGVDPTTVRAVRDYIRTKR